MNNEKKLDHKIKNLITSIKKYERKLKNFNEKKKR